MRKLIVVTAGVLALCGSAQAADNGIYIGGSIGRSSIEVDDAVARGFEGDDTGFKVIVGIRPLDWLGFEASYVDFGEPDDTVDEVKVRSEGDALTGFVVGFFALGPVDVFAKGGLIAWDAKVGNPDIVSYKEDGTDLAYGVGLQFRLLSLGIRAEYERFEVDDQLLDDANMISVGVTYTFL